jgi:hypothetical protein
MTKGNFRKRRREIDSEKIVLLPEDVFPEDAILHEYEGRRISNILLEFASPFISNIDPNNTFQFKIMLYFAALGWNFSYFKEGDERTSALNDFVLKDEQYTPDKKKQMHTIINSLAMRKQQQYWQYDFMLVNFEVIKGEKDSSLIACAIPSYLMDVPSFMGKYN